MKDNLGDITAKSITLVDKKGKPRIILTGDYAEVDDIPRITMLDNKGRERITITIEDHPLICISNTDGSTAVGMNESPGKGGGIGINCGKGKRAIDLSANGPYGRCVIVFDENGMSVGSVPEEKPG